jgi:hypothetical protein
MLAVGSLDIALFLLATATAFVLVTLWILKSDQGKDIYRSEIKKLKSQIEDSEREKYLLAEEVDTLKSAEFAPSGSEASAVAPKPEGSEKLVKTIIAKNETLEQENAKLKVELAEAKSSLEEVYKALCEQ